MKTTLKIQGMHCASCVTILTRALQKVDGVKNAVVNYSTEKATVEYDQTKAKEEDLIWAIKNKGYDAHVMREGERSKEALIRNKELKVLKHKVIISSVLTLPALVLGMFLMDFPFRNYLLWLLATPIQFYIGWPFYKGAWTALRNKTANMDSLIAIGTSAAYFYSLYVVLFDPMGHQYFETSAVLITLVLVGKYL